jgi:CheY-like chemotaxis protein
VRADWLNTRFERMARNLQIPLVLLPLTPRDLRLLTGERAARSDPKIEGKAPALATMAPVLMVEDNEVNRLIGDEFLRAMGLPARMAENGEDALACVAEVTPSLVLMDLQMPGMDGLEAARRMRAMQRDGVLPHFPIIALTAHALESDAQMARAAGMDGFLSKPIMLENLRRELEKWLPALRAARDAENPGE